MADMHSVDRLFELNERWAEKVTRNDPDFFSRLASVQHPDYLWIGCSDSRVPANEIVGLLPGELFVHRNVANLVVHTDLNCLSVMQYAVAALGVRHIIVCGHYGCGGVGAALSGSSLGLIDNWLRHVHDVLDAHADAFEGVPPAQRHDLLCELNVVHQVANVCRTTVVGEQWARGEGALTVHGWIYGLSDGRIRDLGTSVSGAWELPRVERAAIARLIAARTG